MILFVNTNLKKKHAFQRVMVCLIIWVNVAASIPEIHIRREPSVRFKTATILRSVRRRPTTIIHKVPKLKYVTPSTHYRLFSRLPTISAVKTNTVHVANCGSPPPFQGYNVPMRPIYTPQLHKMYGIPVTTYDSPSNYGWAGQGNFAHNSPPTAYSSTPNQPYSYNTPTENYNINIHKTPQPTHGSPAATPYESYAPNYQTQIMAMAPYAIPVEMHMAHSLPAQGTLESVVKDAIKPDNNNPVWSSYGLPYLQTDEQPLSYSTPSASYSTPGAVTSYGTPVDVSKINFPRGNHLQERTEHFWTDENNYEGRNSFEVMMFEEDTRN